MGRPPLSDRECGRRWTRPVSHWAAFGFPVPRLLSRTHGLHRLPAASCCSLVLSAGPRVPRWFPEFRRPPLTSFSAGPAGLRHGEAFPPEVDFVACMCCLALGGDSGVLLSPGPDSAPGRPVCPTLEVGLSQSVCFLPLWQLLLHHSLVAPGTAQGTFIQVAGGRVSCPSGSGGLLRLPQCKADFLLLAPEQTLPLEPLPGGWLLSTPLPRQWVRTGLALGKRRSLCSFPTVRGFCFGLKRRKMSKKWAGFLPVCC